MRQVNAAVEVRGPHRRQWLFERLKDLDNYNRQLEGLVAVEFLQRSGSRNLSRWNLEVQGCPVGWIQEDHFDVDRLAYSFKGREGDFTYLSGLWRVEPTSFGSRLRFDVEWDLGVPIVDDLMGNAVEVQMRRAIGHIMDALKGDAETNNLVNDRLIPRSDVQFPVGITYPGGRSLARIRDVSEYGARVELGEPRLIEGEGLILLPRHTNLPRRLTGQVIWADDRGSVGLRFDQKLVSFDKIIEP